MIEWYLSVKKLIRELDDKIRTLLSLDAKQDSGAKTAIKAYVETDHGLLLEQWQKRYPDEDLGNLGRHIYFAQDHDYVDILTYDLPRLEKRADEHLRAENIAQQPDRIGFEDLLHPRVMEHSYQQYRDGHLRDAVFNSIVSLFDLIRARANSGEDGANLIDRVFSLGKPVLIFSEIETDSGRDEQKGFIQILKGAYLGIRNPKAHTLAHDLTPDTAAQYLVFSSLLARRIDEAKVAQQSPTVSRATPQK